MEAGAPAGLMESACAEGASHGTPVSHHDEVDAVEVGHLLTPFVSFKVMFGTSNLDDAALVIALELEGSMG